MNTDQQAAVRHWSDYGQKGTTPTSRTMPWDWDRHPFVSSQRAVWKIPIHAHQLPLLLLGFKPTESSQTGVDVALFLMGDPITTHRMTSTSKNPNCRPSEDKWFVYADGPDTRGRVVLNMHRSWTGTKVLELEIRVGGSPTGTRSSSFSRDGAEITGIVWETDVRTWREFDEAQAKDMARMICQWVLGVELVVQVFDGQHIQASQKSEAMESERLTELLNSSMGPIKDGTIFHKGHRVPKEVSETPGFPQNLFQGL